MPRLALRFAVVLTALLLASFAARAEDRALLIGIGDYEKLPERMFLHGPVNDVAAMKTLLTGTLGFKPESIKVLLDKEATRSAMIAAAEEWLVAGTKPGDRVYFYYSGHGLQVKDDNGDEEDGLDEAIATYDITPGESDWTNIIRDDDIQALTEKMKDRMVTLIIDACHSGTLSRSLNGSLDDYVVGMRYLPRPSKAGAEQTTRGLKIELAADAKPETVIEGSLTTWSAAAPYQVAWDDDRLPPDERHGVFTAAFVAGLVKGEADSNGNGVTSVSELFQYLKVKSGEYCKLKKDCQSLDPQIEASPQLLGAELAGYTKPAVEEKPQLLKIETLQTPQPVYVAADPVQSVGDILGGYDNGLVAVSIDRGTTLHAGDVFKIDVTSVSGGHLVLLDVNAKGEATQIFPNTAAQKITPLSPNQTLTIPDEYYGFDFEAGESGDSVLVALVINDDIDLSQLVPADQGLETTLNARAALSEIVSRLSKPVATADGFRAVRWTAGKYDYTIK
ncbi:caspase family protein [Rhizobium sp. LjRoot30]|uniref:caspase family protein n=1 Tax=Rhizobium sp. LjRoot30 TaxID=3342320 RepID=UPI003ECFD3E7